MTYVDEHLFVEGHYLGKPADFTDKIVRRRIEIASKIPDFFGKNYELVDVGCGNGASMFLLADQLKSCTGLELFDEHQQSFEKMKAQQNAQNCSFEIFDIENHDYPRQFDRLICFEVIEHLEDEKNARKLYDLLKKGGKAAISVPNKWWIFETHGAKLPLLAWNRVPFFSWLPRPIHERFANARIYTPERITTLLKNVGFQVLDYQYITAPLDVLKDGKVKEWFVKNIFRNNTTSVPFLSTSVFVSVQKI